MDTSFWIDKRAAAGLLILPILIGLIGLAVMIFSGATAGFRAATQGQLAQLAPYARTFNLLNLIFVLSWIAHLLGIGLFGWLLARAGEAQLAVMAFLLILVTVIIAVVYYSFRMSVEIWAAQEVGKGGSLPLLYDALRSWLSDLFRLGYVMHFIAMLGVGWGILRSGLLGSGMAWTTIMWSALLLMGAIAGVGAPAVPLLMPAAIGAALLWK